ncbi:DNA repair protein RecN [Armatimonas sp.]|uniref:DNA repair protein RecN n=1 Tax=Armatimonas sp. TaxID=1872638 RepID=UPI003750F2C1
MLTELSVENFALVERVRLRFGAGLNLLTGETGAGKSILLDALGLVLGERTSADAVRHGAEKARVEAVFALTVGDSRLAPALESTGIEPEDGLLILSRELSASGKSSARINGRPVTVAVLKVIGDALVDIHGQHEHQSLMLVERHVELLDAWCGDETRALKEAVADTWDVFSAARAEREALLREARERTRNLDIYSYQRDEIDAAALVPGEEEELQAERRRLGSAERLHAASAAAYEALQGGALDGLSQAVREIERGLKFDDSLSSILESLNSALYAADDAMREVRTYRDSVEFNPQRLSHIEDRLDLLKSLKRKYGEDIAAMVRYREELGQKLETLENAEERLAALEALEKSTFAEVEKCAAVLTKARKKAAEPFAKGIQTELKDLAMAATRFSVSVVPREPGPGGADAVEFLISPNPGEPLKPLAKIASGGELSRVMLALKSVMSKHVAPPTLVFDEIDTGIGGRTATVLAQKLHALGQAAQTLCITHLPQIAARGDMHFFIEKRTEKGRTTVSVLPLEGEARVQELARMLGGNNSETVLAHAREMLEHNKIFLTTT